MHNHVWCKWQANCNHCEEFFAFCMESKTFLYFACCKTHVLLCYIYLNGSDSALHPFPFVYLHVRNVQAAFISNQLQTWSIFSTANSTGRCSYEWIIHTISVLHRCNIEIGSDTTLSYSICMSSRTYPISSTSNNKRAIRAKSGIKVHTGLRSIVLGTEFEGSS